MRFQPLSCCKSVSSLFDVEVGRPWPISGGRVATFCFPGPWDCVHNRVTSGAGMQCACVIFPKINFWSRSLLVKLCYVALLLLSTEEASSSGEARARGKTLAAWELPKRCLVCILLMSNFQPGKSLRCIPCVEFPSKGIFLSFFLLLSFRQARLLCRTSVLPRFSKELG